ncbi:MAG: hypothetical protein LBQ52_03715 [Helicobacteraceae bacterium]|nr:hypothetical protein [Helicobacteraceae bacterium]
MGVIRKLAQKITIKLVKKALKRNSVQKYLIQEYLANKLPFLVYGVASARAKNATPPPPPQYHTRKLSRRVYA